LDLKRPLWRICLSGLIGAARHWHVLTPRIICHFSDAHNQDFDGGEPRADDDWNGLHIQASKDSSEVVV
jgi:hypothetical protein